MVIPLSVAFSGGQQYVAMRQLMECTAGTWKFSFFDREPHALFGEDVKTRTPVTLVREGTPGASVVAVRRVNELDYYNLVAKKLAAKVKLSVFETLAVVKHIGLQDDEACFKEIQIDSQKHKRYSQAAIGKIKDCLAQGDLSTIVELQKARSKAKKRV